MISLSDYICMTVHNLYCADVTLTHSRQAQSSKFIVWLKEFRVKFNGT